MNRKKAKEIKRRLKEMGLNPSPEGHKVLTLRPTGKYKMATMLNKKTGKVEAASEPVYEAFSAWSRAKKALKRGLDPVAALNPKRPE